MFHRQRTGDISRLTDYIDRISTVQQQILEASIENEELADQLNLVFDASDLKREAIAFVTKLGESYSIRQRTATMKIIRNISEGRRNFRTWSSVAQWLLTTSPMFLIENLDPED